MVRLNASGYVELHCHSAFSLLDGAALPETLVQRAVELGHTALALTDHDDLGGAVRFAQAADEHGLAAIIGAELTIAVDGHASAERSSPSASVHHLVLLAENREGYGNLCSLITAGRMQNDRGQPSVPLDTVAHHAAGLFALTACARGWVPSLIAEGRATELACDAAAELRDIFDGRLAIECWDHGLAEEREISRGLIDVAHALGVPWVVTNDVHYARARDRMIQDVLSCLRHERTLDEMGTRLRPNGEWYLKSAAQMRRRWRHAPEGIQATLQIAERCAFRMTDLEPSLPAFPLPHGVTADEYLARLVEQGAQERWGESGGAGHRTARHDEQIAHELELIAKLGLAGYFLIVWDIVRFARREGVLCQGRGSAANSAVCYCLGITSVDPIRLGLLFERFLSEERREAPDIDIDFAHRDREKVIQYVYEKYGRDHAAMVCEQITYRGRSAVRDAARVLGFSVEQAEKLCTVADRYSARATADALRGLPPDHEGEAGGESHEAAIARAFGQTMVAGTEATTEARKVKEAAKRGAGAEGGAGGRPRYMDPHARMTHNERRNPTTATRPTGSSRSPVELAGLDPADKRVRALARIVNGLHQVPRHRSIHVGGFVLTAEPLSTIVPIEPASMKDRTVIQWEKDDLDPMKLVKIDLLGLGMLTLIQDCLKYVRQMRGVTIDLGQLDMEDQSVFDDLCRADTIGIFQVESRAQMSTLPRLKPRTFYDIVVEVAIIRPGPIQGDLVHPYLRRRANEEAVTYPHPSLEPILSRTLGVPLFQEQGMQVAIACAGFSPSEADALRRAMGHKRSHERMAAVCQRMIDGMRANGIPDETAMSIYNQINAFADYGFPESHAASFALLVYASAYLKHYYAPEFTAAILNAQPMGFYAPGTLVEDAKRHGVVVRPVDASRSRWDATLERDEAPGTSSGGTATAPAVRLGFRSVHGLGPKAQEILDAAWSRGGTFTSIDDFVARTSFDRRSLRHLAEAGAFDCFAPNEPALRKRRAALWDVLERARGDAGPLAPGRRRRASTGGGGRAPAEPGDQPVAASPPLPAMTPHELTEADYRMTGISLNGHPLSHLREVLAPNGIRRAKEILDRGRDGERVAVAGLVICRQRPGTAKGFVFLTLEDETGTVNVIVTPKRFERQALLIARSPLLLVRGVLQVEQGVFNIRGEEFRELNAAVGAEFAGRHDFH